MLCMTMHAHAFNLLYLPWCFRQQQVHLQIVKNKIIFFLLLSGVLETSIGIKGFKYI